MPSLSDLLTNNRQWAARRRDEDPGFFPRLAQQQLPKYLWIGCADSRVPANEVVGLDPGELFVHRNVANVVVHTDLNCLSVIQYAVEVLQVEHVIVCGHYGCGGVQAAWRGRPLGLIDNWLRHVQDIASPHLAELERLGSEDATVARLCELNVLAQVVHVARTTIVQDAWRRGQPLALHGWIYGLEDGIINDLGLMLTGKESIEIAHAAAVAASLARESGS
ncbi:MAG: carbonate dehydratase [Gemmatimonadales bacterium]|nr:carbonate dehydratase [Gemmatimonadales bacterium]MDZ4389023.1 carbonate dehydratase [Gemmatimonadales bacterium]